MREILFKAKRKDNGEWIYGFYLNFMDKHFICSSTHVLCMDSYSKEGQSYGFGDFYEVDPETLCQYTGLKDKKGNKIWENDILRGHGNNKDFVKVVFGEFNVIDAETLETVDKVIGWHTEVIETDMLSKCLPFCLPMPLNDFYIRRCEYDVIGTTFDNPELLEE